MGAAHPPADPCWTMPCPTVVGIRSLAWQNASKPQGVSFPRFRGYRQLSVTTEAGQDILPFRPNGVELQKEAARRDPSARSPAVATG